MSKRIVPAITIITGDITSGQVFLSGKPLSARHSQEVYNHSPDGFSWGYAGSGPAQLALAILLTRTDEETALKIYQDFKFEFVASWPNYDFEVGIALDDWIIKKGGKIMPNENDFGLDNTDEEEGAPCGVKCLYAEGKDCMCSCNGENHGSLNRNKQLKFF